jgi:solute carrier family 25 (mitochondrial phosphate transporter), member 3
MASPSSDKTPTFTISDYVKFFGAGALAATLTHGVSLSAVASLAACAQLTAAQAATPIDVVKTRIQVDDAMKGLNMVRAARTIVAQEGASALLTGFGPTAVGYLVQGGGKFAGYEYFKKKYVDLVGGPEKATQYRMPIYLTASASAEFFADIALCPLEATRIRLVSQRGYATGLFSGFARMAREEGLRGFYSGFVPLLFKQVPYAVGQFSVHEAANEVIFRAMGPERKAAMTHLQATGVELTSGIVAGVAAAVLSHPADTLLSAINKGAGDKSQSATARMFTLAREFGPKRLLLSGLGPRIVMTCGLVAGQFVIYAQCKALVGAPMGIEIHKEEKLEA